MRAPRPVTCPRGGQTVWRRPLNVNELSKHINHCRAPATNTTDHGRRLEQLAIWLFSHVPGFTATHSNVFSANRAHEVDVAFFNEPAAGGGFGLLGSKVFVECKNYDHPVGGQEVAWFDHKLIQGGSIGGILLAAKGVTGTAHDRTFAHGVIAEALRSSPSRTILVLTLDQIATIGSSAGLHDLIRDQIMLTSMGRSF
jgi:hypothetical protein